MNHWVLILAALAALASAASAANSEKKVVCYFGSWAVYRPGAGKFEISNIEPNLCTHLIYTFIGITEDGNIRVLDSWQDLPDNYGKDAFGRFNKLRELSPNTKTLIAIGGWNEGSARYSTVVGNPQLRAKFVKNVVEFLQKYGFDGFDVDWEYPNQRGGKPADKENFTKLLQELQAAFKPHKYLLTAAVAAAEHSASLSYDIAAICKALDFVNIMSYDLHGSWEKVTGHNAPLYPRQGETGKDLTLNVDAIMQFWKNNGCSYDKMILGVPFYGRSFTLANSAQNGLGAPTTGPGTAGKFTREPGMLGYNEICENIKQGGWTVVRHKEHRTPYAYKGNQWVGYDDVESLTEKTAYIKSLGLGGVMLWSIETDDFGGHCGEKYPLLKTLNAGLKGGASVSPTTAPRIEQPKQPKQPPQPPVTEPLPTIPPSDLCDKEGYIRDKQDCNVFYRCQNINGVYNAQRFVCAPGLVFDTKIGNCNYKHLVPGCK